MDLLIDRVAGLDVHRDTVMACVRTPKPPGRRGRVTETEEFGSVTKELRRLAVWLGEREVTHVAMEATGVYWKPVFRRVGVPLRGDSRQRRAYEECAWPKDRRG